MPQAKPDTETSATAEDPRALAISDLARRCTQETSRYFRRQAHDPRFCLELFRRAISESNQDAWAAVFAQYQPLVAGWVARHPAFDRCGEDRAYFVNRAFEKLWSAMIGRSASHFGSLSGILRYLQMCVHSAVVDHIRQLESPVDEPQPFAMGEADVDPELSARDPQLERIEREEFWALIDGKLRDKKEKQVVYASYVLGLKPQEICHSFHKLFRSPEDVYLAKQNVLARLRRDLELRHLLGLDD